MSNGNVKAVYWSDRRLAEDREHPVTRWRIIPVRHFYMTAPSIIRWVIYRNGARMWTKTSLPEATEYVYYRGAIK